MHGFVRRGLVNGIYRQCHNCMSCIRLNAFHRRLICSNIPSVVSYSLLFVNCDFFISEIDTHFITIRECKRYRLPVRFHILRIGEHFKNLFR